MILCFDVANKVKVMVEGLALKTLEVRLFCLENEFMASEREREYIHELASGVVFTKNNQ